MWEEIDYDQGDSTARMRVPGGWLVRTVIGHLESPAVHMIFFPDPHHDWVVEEKKK